MAPTEPTNFFRIAWVLFKGLAWHSAENTFRISARLASFQLLFSILVFMAGAIWVWLSATCEQIPVSDPFERSGSVLVLVAIYLDYSYRESAVAEISRSMQGFECQPAARYMINFANFVRPFAIFSGIFGTIIWGYGSEL